MKTGSPFILWVYRFLALGIVVLILRFAFLHEHYLPESKTVSRCVLPIAIVMLLISWVRYRITTIFMAIYVLLIPLVIATAIRLIVLHDSPWWDFALALCVVMILPILFAWLITHEPGMLSYYTPVSSPRSEPDHKNC